MAIRITLVQHFYHGETLPFPVGETDMLQLKLDTEELRLDTEEEEEEVPVFLLPSTTPLV